MKYLTTFILVLSLILCLPGCAAAQPEAAGGGFVFTHAGVHISMKAEAAPILDALGEPKGYTEEASCAFDGLDKTYFYGSFYLSTYPMDGKDYIYSLWFTDNSVATAEGISIGSVRAEVERAYGAEAFNGSNAYQMTRGESKLTIVLTDGAVSSIQYFSVFA